jgi:iron transport multicopper oxidase
MTESTVITLSDWYHTPALEAGYGPNQDSNLINGKGRYWGGPQEPLAVINVVQGKRYRIRLLAIVCHPNYVFSIDGHNFTYVD